MSDEIKALGITSREPNRSEGALPQRLSVYQEGYVQSMLGGKLTPLADEGTYFTATNATLGTAITGTAAPTAFSATVALMSMYNSASAGSKKRIYPDWLLLSPKAAGTNGTNFSFAMSGDTVNRYSSGGTAITPVNPNMDSSTASVATMYVGALTATAASTSVRRLAHGILRTVIKVIGDQYLFVFGDGAPRLAGIPLEGTTQAALIIPCPPVVIGPGQSWLFHEIAASQSVAATYEFSMGWWER